MGQGAAAAAACDLCGAHEGALLLDPPPPRAMRSDRVPVDVPLRKVECGRCGLVRSAAIPGAGELERMYEDEYAAGLGSEHRFHTPSGPVLRSTVFADWMTEALPAPDWEGARILEVGAGTGALLHAVRTRFPRAEVSGVEPSAAAAAAARQAGRPVVRARVDSIPPGPPHDIVYAVAVIEHVPSPTAFLGALRARLREGGVLLLAQPTQDVPSYDILFVDHLHHFRSDHLRAYARKCGFREEVARIGHPLMPNFSLHAWRAASTDGVAWDGPPARTGGAATARALLADMARLDRLLDRLGTAGRRVAAFGVAEVHWLARSYSRLGAFPLVCGLDDQPEGVDAAGLGFPVVVPEEARRLGVQDVLLTMNAIYYPMAEERVRRLGLVPHPVLTAPVLAEARA